MNRFTALALLTATLYPLAACGGDDPLAQPSPSEREIVEAIPAGPDRDAEIQYWLTHDLDAEQDAARAKADEEFKRLTEAPPPTKPAISVNPFDPNWKEPTH
jgi:hypothetical protein